MDCARNTGDDENRRVLRAHTLSVNTDRTNGYEVWGHALVKKAPRRSLNAQFWRAMPNKDAIAHALFLAVVQIGIPDKIFFITRMPNQTGRT
jgi:hypothetical protein